MNCEHELHTRSLLSVVDDGSVSCSECGDRWVQASKLPRWRIVADELPPLREPVICWSPSGAEKLRMPMFVSYRFRDEGEGTPWFYHESPPYPVTHWMPLPEAPQ